MKTRALMAAIALAVIALVVWGFMEGRKERATEAEREKPVVVPSRVSRVDGLPAITLDAASQKSSGIAVIPQHATAHHQEIQAIGTVLLIQDLSALRTGIVAAQSQVAAASAAAQASQAEYQRLLVLHREEQDVSTRTLQAGESSRRADTATLQAAQAALAAARQNASQQWGPVLTRAAAENSTLYTRLVNQQDVLLQVVLPAGADLAQPPSQVRVQLRRDTFVTARLVAAATRTDARLQGASFFYVAPAAGLLPGSSLTVFLPVGAAKPGSMIPTSAIVWWQGSAWVYSRRRADLFVRRELPADQAVQDGWFVPAGFAGGEPVVVTGAQLLFSEELRAQISVGEDAGK